MNQDKIETVRKLLAKAGASGTTEAEREAFTAKATELMIKYGIEDAMLANAERAAAEKIIDKHVIVTGTFAPELMHMCVLAMKALGLTPYYVKTRSSGIHVHIVGFESDVTRGEMLATSLILQAPVAMRQWWSSFKNTQLNSPTATESYKMRRSFLVGFGRAVADRLTLQRMQVVTEAVSENPGTDLVLVKREEQVTEWVSENIPGLRPTRGRGRSYWQDGMIGGKAAGATANLGGTGVANSSGGKAVGS